MPKPIYSSLRIEDEELLEVVNDFIDRLDDRLAAMQQSLRDADFQRVRNEAHWLHGSGGTVGFKAFTDPAKRLEDAADREETDAAWALLGELRSIRSRIVAPAIGQRGDHREPRDAASIQPTSQSETSSPVEEARDDTPIRCALPLEDQEFCDIVIGFIERLDVRLMGMLSMAQKRAFEELENEAHWLKGAGGTIGFPAFTEPAIALMNAAKDGDVESCQSQLRDLLEIRRRLVVPRRIHG